MGYPQPLGGLSNRVQRNGQTRGVAEEFDLVSAVKMYIGLPIGDQDEFGNPQFGFYQLLQLLLRAFLILSVS